MTDKRWWPTALKRASTLSFRPTSLAGRQVNFICIGFPLSLLKDRSLPSTTQHHAVAFGLLPAFPDRPEMRVKTVAARRELPLPPLLLLLLLLLLISCCIFAASSFATEAREAETSALITSGTSPPPAERELSEPPAEREKDPKEQELRWAVLLPYNDSFMFSVRKCVPAMRLAVERMRAAGVLRRRVSLVHADSDCSGVRAPIEMFRLVTAERVVVLFGPCCDYSLAPVGRFAPHWNVPVITAGGMSHAFSQKTTGIAEFSLLTRVGANFNALADTVMAVWARGGWERIKLLYFKDGMDRVANGFCHLAVSAVVDQLKTRATAGGGGSRTVWRYDYRQLVQGDDMSVTLREEVGNQYSVVFMCASPDAVREIMIEAANLNFTNGEYVFFNIDLFSSKAALQTPWKRANDTTARNELAQRAYGSLLTVTLRKPASAEYSHFSDEVKRRAKEEFNFTYDEDEVNSFVGAFHDAVLLYTMALNETIAAGGDISNGTEVTRRMWNRTFEGITGTVSIDANGDRNADYSIMAYRKDSEQFEVVASYYGSRGGSGVLVPEKEMYWPYSQPWPPPDVPRCGFDGSGCPPPPEVELFPVWAIVTIVFSTLLVVVATVGFFVYRHYKLEYELAQMSWRVKWEDIAFGQITADRRAGGGGGVGTASSRHEYARRSSIGSAKYDFLFRRGSLYSKCSNDASVGGGAEGLEKQQQIFANIGYYKAAVVAIKPLRCSRPGGVTLSKPLLIEMKQLKDLQNDHVTRFIGACVDAPNECVLTEYCPRGSLQDILENDRLDLDWMFKYSLFQDISRGMEYLHSSEVKYHGNLKSSNCVVDSRFVIKVTDFGLRSLRQLSKYDHREDEYQYYRQKLWRAPEFYSDISLHRSAASSVLSMQKGDVYSFAIICQEIIYRNGVFYLSDGMPSPKEIIEQATRDRSFRPTLCDDDCEPSELAALVRRCWSPEPNERLDFTSIKAIVRRLNRDASKGNLVDNLLARMEQYADNLESLVKERTADYLEQKQRAENLLFMMLPPSIAHQLISGLTVKAESYDSVTIYFSDICGFTSLSAESTPMQIVKLLNDLYTAFDTIVEGFDVYKVETIGDAYMVVSGLPERNGVLHSREIARMSLKLLEAVQSFKIAHRPDDRLHLRIGMHTGPVCAGVVGLKMPRYCLFGDTVNTASRMESNGLPLKIHISQATKDALDTFGSFRIELRGPVEMKGKGWVTTYWLLGEDHPPASDTDLRDAVALQNAPGVS